MADTDTTAGEKEPAYPANALGAGHTQRSDLGVGDSPDEMGSQTSVKAEEGDGGQTRNISPGMSKMQTFLLVFALCSATFLAALDITIVTTALPTISQHFHTNVGYIWVGAAYVLADGASTPVWSKLSDIWGRKPMLLIAIAVFFIGSTVSATAVSIGMLIAGRAVQGMGGGGLLVFANIVISDLFSMRDRAKYFGFIGMTWAIACSIGPLLGGALSQKASWRWCFYINLPCTAVVFVLVYFTLTLKTPKTPIIAGIKALDWLGCLTIVGGTVMVLLGLNFGGSSFPWKSAKVICLIIFGVVLWIAFFVIEWRVAKAPIIPLNIINTGQRGGALLSTLLHGFVLSLGFYFLPLYFQSVLGAGALFSGVLLLPLTISVSFAAAITGWAISATGSYTWFIRGGFVLMLLGSGLLIDLPHSRTWAGVVIFQIILGLGIGPNFQALLVALQSAVKTEDQGTAVAAFSFARNLATGVGVVLGEVVFQNVMHKQSNKLNASLDPSFAARLANGGAAASVFDVDHLPDDQKNVARDAYYTSIRDVWIMQTAFAAVALLAICFIRGRTLSEDHTVVETGLDVEARRTEQLEKERREGGGRQETSV